MSSYEIRVADENDFQVIREIAIRTWPETYGNTLSVQQIQYMLALFYSDEGLSSAIVNGQKFILLSENSDPKGFASMLHGYETDATKINKLYVLPDCQGKGFGKAMLLHIADLATEHGSRRIVLNVNRFNKAKDFYHRFGFEIIGSEDIEIGSGYLMEDFVMERKL